MRIDVKAYANRFELLCVGLIPVVLIAPALIWFFGDKLMDSTYGLHLASFSFLKRFSLFLISSIGSLFVAYGLWLCVQIARHLKKDELFASNTAELFARVSRIAAYWGLYNVLEIIGYYLFIIPNIPKPLMILTLGMHMLFYFFIFIFLTMLATLVAKASDLQQDQDLTV